MKDYHSRYKICEAHLKAKSAIKDGIQQRFCQQCGKFHPVEDFDGDKRSCRARLDKHNARRRRMREMQHMLRTTGTVDEAALQAKYGLSEEELAPKVKKLQASMSKSVRKSNNGVHTPTGSMGHGSQSGNSSAGNLPGLDLSGLPGITQADLDLLGDDFLEDVLGPIPGMPQNAAGAAASFLAIDPASIMDLDDMAVLEELTREFGIDANAAALSAAQGGHALLGGKPHVAVPSTPSAAAGAFPAHSAPVSIHMPPGGHQGYPYVTQQQAALLAGMSQQRFSGPGGARGQFPFMPGQSPAGPSNTVTTGAAPTSLPPYMMQGMPQASNVSNPVAVRSSTNSVNFNGTDQPTVMEEALNLLAYDRSQVAYAAQEKLVRCSTKLFGCTPADLPPDLKASLMDMLVVEGMEGFMRPGCVHLEIDALVGPEEQAVLADGGMRAAIERYLAADTSGASAERTIVFQIGDKMALVVNGELKHVVCTAGAGSLLPSLEAVRPMALPAPAGRNAEVIVALWGNNLREEDTVLARSKGEYAAATYALKECLCRL